MMQKMSTAKSWSFEKINKTKKSLTKLIQKEERKTQVISGMKKRRLLELLQTIRYNKEIF